MALVGGAAILLDRERQTVELARPGMKLDLGGIAKGYASGEAIAVLKREGVASALVAGSGDIVVSDPPPRSPRLADRDRPARSRASDRRHFGSNGDSQQRRHLDLGRRRAVRRDRRQTLLARRRPKTGLGLTDRRSVTVIAPDGALARRPGHHRLRPGSRKRAIARRVVPRRLGPLHPDHARGAGHHRVERVEPTGFAYEISMTIRATVRPGRRPFAFPWRSSRDVEASVLGSGVATSGSISRLALMSHPSSLGIPGKPRSDCRSRRVGRGPSASKRPHEPAPCRADLAGHHDRDDRGFDEPIRCHIYE